MQTTARAEWPLSYPASLVSFRARNTIDVPTVTVHHYEEEIAGRLYCIEVSAVSAERWRAQLARRPGMPAAMMPFYGPTPERAAQELSKWLTMLSPGAVPKS
jgi:hypothetical protein